MFTGIIESVGTVTEIVPHGDDLALHVRCVEVEVAPDLQGWRGDDLAMQILCDGIDPATLVVGESIATSGVCLTVRECTPAGFVADVSVETLRRTTLGSLGTGERVNLERSLQVGDRLGGHFVFGHVDGVGRVVDLRREGTGYRLAIEAPADLARLIAVKGSIAVDGVSLTVADLAGRVFEVALIPHTAEVTTAGGYRPGRAVNLEADMLARYVERLVARA